MQPRIEVDIVLDGFVSNDEEASRVLAERFQALDRPTQGEDDLFLGLPGEFRSFSEAVQRTKEVLDPLFEIVSKYRPLVRVAVYFSTATLTLHQEDLAAISTLLLPVEISIYPCE